MDDNRYQIKVLAQGLEEMTNHCDDLSMEDINEIIILTEALFKAAFDYRLNLEGKHKPTL